MSTDHAAHTSADVASTGNVGRKRWSTPRVILSDVRAARETGTPSVSPEHFVGPSGHFS